jgi:hypothetical protein
LEVRRSVGGIYDLSLQVEDTEKVKPE